MSPRIRKQIFIWVPKPRNLGKVEINGENVTSRVLDSSFIWPLLRLGIGSFSITLKDPGGAFLESFQKGQDVKYYMGPDNPPTSLRYWGRVDYVKKVQGPTGQFLEVIGRHRAYRLGEITVCHKATNEDHGNILKAIAAKEAPEFTTTNVNLTTLTTDVEWDYTPFLDCVRQIGEDSNSVAYVDNDLGIHFFEEGSILNMDAAVWEGDTYIKLTESGVDDFNERTQVIATGQDDNGLSIIHTHPEIITGAVRESYVRDLSANTMEKVKKLAEARYNDVNNRKNQMQCTCHALKDVSPGDKIYTSIYREKIQDRFNIMQITDQFGSKVKFPKTLFVFNQEINSAESTIRDRKIIENRLSSTGNVNKLKFSYNMDMKDDTKTQSHDGTEIIDETLVLETGQTSGTWISNAKDSAADITRGELKYVGKDLGASTFRWSVNNGTSFESIAARNTLLTPIAVGSQIKLEIKLISNTLNPAPAVFGAALQFD